MRIKVRNTMPLRNILLSESANISGTENPLPNEKVGAPPRLKLSVLKNEMKLKPHVKAHGGPKTHWYNLAIKQQN